MPYKARPLADRLWAKVNKTLTCWFWIGSKSKSGYGIIKSDGGKKSLSVHRVVWELFFGPIPDGLHVLHKCDVRLCVNLEHLFLGTPLDNMRDRDFKNRHIPSPGERNGQARFTAQDIIAIRKLSAEKVSGVEIARRFGMCKQHVSDIINRKRWAHVP